MHEYQPIPGLGEELAEKSLEAAAARLHELYWQIVKGELMTDKISRVTHILKEYPDLEEDFSRMLRAQSYREKYVGGAAEISSDRSRRLAPHLAIVEAAQGSETRENVESHIFYKIFTYAVASQNVHSGQDFKQFLAQHDFGSELDHKLLEYFESHQQ